MITLLNRLVHKKALLLVLFLLCSPLSFVQAGVCDNAARTQLLSALHQVDMRLLYWRDQKKHYISYFFSKSPHKWVMGLEQGQEIAKAIKALECKQAALYNLLGRFAEHGYSASDAHEVDVLVEQLELISQQPHHITRNWIFYTALIAAAGYAGYYYMHDTENRLKNGLTDCVSYLHENVWQGCVVTPLKDLRSSDVVIDAGDQTYAQQAKMSIVTSLVGEKFLSTVRKTTAWVNKSIPLIPLAVTSLVTSCGLVKTYQYATAHDYSQIRVALADIHSIFIESPMRLSDHDYGKLVYLVFKLANTVAYLAPAEDTLRDEFLIDLEKLESKSFTAEVKRGIIENMFYKYLFLGRDIKSA